MSVLAARVLQPNRLRVNRASTFDPRRGAGNWKVGVDIEPLTTSRAVDSQLPNSVPKTVDSRVGILRLGVAALSAPGPRAPRPERESRAGSPEPTHVA